MSILRNIGTGLIYYQVGKGVFSGNKKPKRIPVPSEKKPTVVRPRFTEGQMIDLVKTRESMRRPARGYNLRPPVELSPRAKLISIVRKSALARRVFPVRAVTKGRSELIGSVRNTATRPMRGNPINSRIARFYYARRHV